MHYTKLKKAFHDRRYITIDGSPLFVIYDPEACPKNYIENLQRLAKEDGFKNGLFLVGNITKRKTEKRELLNKGFSAVIYQRLTNDVTRNIFHRVTHKFNKFIMDKLFNWPYIADYRKAHNYLVNPAIDSDDDVFPTILPNWDHTPRSGVRGTVFKNANPSEFKKLAKKALSVIANKPSDRQLIFLKSWNEWGEGNYMEPDLKYGKGYIKALREALDEYGK